MNRWKQLLPKIRNLMKLLQRSRPDNDFSPTQISLALNCIYHDISWSVACKDDPQVPRDVYNLFIKHAGAVPDMYLGICAPIYQVRLHVVSVLPLVESGSFHWNFWFHQILGDITALAVEANTVESIEDRDDRFERISAIIKESRGLDHRIDLLEVSTKTLSRMAAWQEDEQGFMPQPLISTFQAFKFAAHAYLRQVVYKLPAISIEAQLSVTRMLTRISSVLDTPSQSQMLFPLFIAGVDAVREEDRKSIKMIFERLHAITGTGNIKTVFDLLLEIWRQNDHGATWVDWRLIASNVSRN